MHGVGSVGSVGCASVGSHQLYDLRWSGGWIFVDPLICFIQLLSLLGHVCRQFDWACLAWCLMGNHYHLLVETRQATLSRGMRHLNGVYTQRFNRRHGRTGHVFQGRFAAVMVARDCHLLAASRYIVLNPVRAGLVRTASDWRWSSFAAHCGLGLAPAWLDDRRVLSLLHADPRAARCSYRAYVEREDGEPTLWDSLRNQIYLGDDAFVEQMQSHARAEALSPEVPRVQQQPAAAVCGSPARDHASRNEAIVAAFAGGGFTQKQLADHFGIHYSMVSKILARSRQERFKT